MKSFGLVLLCIIILAAAGIATAQFTGLVHVNSLLSRLPLISTSQSQPAQASGGRPADAASYNSLLLANSKLKQQLAALQAQVAQANGGQPGSAAQNAGGITTQSIATEQPETYKDLAGYYADMKPAAAVAILGNLDPNMVAGILYEMNKDQAGQILAGMDPAQAAKVIKLIASLSNANPDQQSDQGMEATP